MQFDSLVSKGCGGGLVVCKLRRFLIFGPYRSVPFTVPFVLAHPGLFLLPVRSFWACTVTVLERIGLERVF